MVGEVDYGGNFFPMAKNSTGLEEILNLLAEETMAAEAAVDRGFGFGFL